MTTSSNPDEIRAEIERTRHALGQDVDALAEKVSPTKAVSRQTNRVKDGFITVKENIMGTPEHHEGPGAVDRARFAAQDAAGQVQGTAHDVADQARGYAQQAGEAASQWVDDAQHAVQQAPAQVRGRTAGNPLAAGLIALGAGWLIGSLIPASPVEKRAAERVKDQAAPLLESAKQEAAQVAQDVREQVEPEVRDAAASLKDSAAESVQSLKSEGAEKAQDLKGSSQDAAQQVKHAAEHA
ncbi:DUF3618 domain-containing protein [Micrococcus sp. ACRRV]|uniref:DUF3618 domain-containing protein n=1 Tax=Micrococcus sp. ACRRV TaxID=2918203 RepID=UPI001EF39C75|nr:DUF3618 domain-containing protein [Micrococcus sp. ACRRV]MCG7422593.1 DUF3618 domain-containing protein [Micrococcus sp. ACRRV]